MLITSGNDDFWIELLRDSITYDKRSSTGIEYTFDNETAGFSETSSEFSREFVL
jgi:hypothetical protein